MIEWTWLILIVIPLAILFQNFIHEVGHLLVGFYREGREPLDLVIWPHKYKGRWYWARALMGSPKKKDPTRLLHIIPFWTSLVMCLITGILFFVLPVQGRICVLPSFGAALATIIFFWYCYFFSKNPYADGYRYRHGLQE